MKRIKVLNNELKDLFGYLYQCDKTINTEISNKLIDDLDYIGKSELCSILAFYMKNTKDIEINFFTKNKKRKGAIPFFQKIEGVKND